ncbi:MAG: UDP-N-acetylmuramoyl-L-alanyl-D-glutamate--2,6-diaminopimelate ligase [Patescibacteria group bacterium]
MMNFFRRITPCFLLSWYHYAWALLGALVFRFPGRGLVIVGVTGTNGKSTTVDMLSRIFEEAGLRSSSASSVRFRILQKEWRNTLKMTMPGRFAAQKFLRQAKDAGCTHAVLEVTSEGILQYRHRFIPFHTAVFTNLSPEHIERHGSFERYKQTKGKLFAAAKEVHVMNADDEHAPFFLQFSAKKKYLYSTRAAADSLLVPSKEEGAEAVVGKNAQADESGVRFELDGVTISLKLLGEFNVENALAAIAAARAQGISLQVCKKALESMEGVPGRMEQVLASPFRVVVDYAFTPAALEKVYAALKPEHGKLLCVLGAAGGGRDAWKRPVLGRIAAASCDIVLVTNEDPYEEDPRNIMEEVVAGPAGKGEIVEDRREAIRKALSLAQPGDAIIITGKGSEDSIASARGKKIPWDDREVVREEFSRISMEPE